MDALVQGEEEVNMGDEAQMVMVEEERDTMEEGMMEVMMAE